MLAAITAFCAAPSAPADSPETSHEVNRLVQELGAGEFAVRESATRRLAAMGSEAKGPLTAALESDDPEVRRRARRALRFVLDGEFEERLAAFALDRDDAGHGLPGWRRFRELVGHGPTARRLFVDMQRAEAGLLEAYQLGLEQLSAAAPPRDGVEAAAGQLGELLEDRAAKLQRSMRSSRSGDQRLPDDGALAALLFVGSDDTVAVPTRTSTYIGYMMNRMAAADAAASGGHEDRGALLRKLLAAWVGRDYRGDISALNQALGLALRFDLPEGLPRAHELLAAPNASPAMRLQAILVVGRFGLAEDREQLTPLLADATVCSTYRSDGVQISTEIRDVALATLIHMAGQRPQDFGFDRARNHDRMLFVANTLGFADDADRQAALQKWTTSDRPKSDLPETVRRPNP